MSEKKPVGVYEYLDTKKAPDTTTITFEGRKPGRGQYAVLDLAAIYDYTTEDKHLRLGKRDEKSKDHWINGWKESEKFGFVLLSPLIIDENEMPIAQVVTPDADDVLYCTFQGLLYKKA